MQPLLPAPFFHGYPRWHCTWKHFCARSPTVFVLGLVQCDQRMDGPSNRRKSSRLLVATLCTVSLLTTISLYQIGVASVFQSYTTGLPSSGVKFAFKSLREGNFEIYLMNSNGTNQTRLTNDADILNIHLLGRLTDPR